MFPDLVREFYSNLKLEDLFHKSFVRGKEINIHIDQFGRMFKLPFFGVSHTYEEPIKFKRFQLFTAIKSFVMNLMEDRKFPIK